MVTEAVIREMYEKFNTPPENPDALNIPYFIDLLKKYHPMRLENDVLIVENAAEYSLFRRILINRLTAVMEFNKYVAFVMNEHIFFFEKRGKGMHLHFCNQKKIPFWKRVFSKIFKH